MDMQTTDSPSSASKSNRTPGGDFLVISAWDLTTKSSGAYFTVHQDELQREGNRIKYVGPELTGSPGHGQSLQKNEFIHDIVDQFDTIGQANMRTLQLSVKPSHGMSEDFHEITEAVQIRAVDIFLQLRDHAEMIALYQYQRDEETFRDSRFQQNEPSNTSSPFSWLDVWDTQPMLDLRQAVAEPAKAGTAIGDVFETLDMPLSNETIERLNELSGDRLISPKAMGDFLYDGHHRDHTGQLDLTRGEYRPLNSYITKLEKVQKQMHKITKGRSLYECGVITDLVDRVDRHPVEQAARKTAEMRDLADRIERMNPELSPAHRLSPFKPFKNSPTRPNFLTRIKEFVSAQHGEGRLAPDLSRTYEHKADHPAEQAARKAAERVSEQVSDQMRDVQAPTGILRDTSKANATLLTDCLTKAIGQDGAGKEINNIGYACGLIMPGIETTARFENLTASHLLKVPALVDIFAKGHVFGSEDALRNYLTQLEQIQHKMQQELSNDPAYQQGTLRQGNKQNNLDTTQLNLSPAEIKQFKTLVSEGRLLPSDINHAASDPSSKAEAEFKKIVGKAFDIRENQNRGFALSR